MDIGMLWYDDDKQRRFDEKVARAVAYYRTKYGVQPTDCYVHPGMLADDHPAMTAGGAHPVQLVAGVRLRANRTVIKNHFWLGVGEHVNMTTASGGAKAKSRAPKS
jgi:hypothetical protein